MIQFPLDPQICLILNAFNQASTLRGAALKLGIDAPALVRKVQKIAEQHGYLQKVGNRWAITEPGRRIAQWTDEVMTSQKIMLNEKPTFRIASFAWLAEEMLIPYFPRLQKEFGRELLWSYAMTSSHNEQELIQGRADFVIQGHAPTDPSVASRKIAFHPWIVVLPMAWKKELHRLKKFELIAQLMERPMIRHSQVNASEAMGFNVATFADLTIDSIVGVRSAVASELGWSIVPRMAAQSLLRQQKVFSVDLPTNVKDEVSVWWLRARKDVARHVPRIHQWVENLPVL